MKAGVWDTTMKVHVEHELANDKTVLEEFKGVESFANPPMTDTLHLTFQDDRTDKKLNYGHVAKATDKK